MTAFSWHRRHTRTQPTGKPSVEPFWQVLALGLVTVLFGVAVLVWPDRTLQLLGTLVGVWLIVLGAMRAFAAFDRKQETSKRVLLGIIAAVLIAVGIACVRNAAGGVLVLAAIVGLAWLLSGFATLTIGLIATGAARAWLSVLGVISVLVGLALLLWPGPSLTTLVLLTGISALLIGAAETAYALRLRRDRHAGPRHDPAQAQPG